jgi:transcription antitermination factor NusG
VSHLILPSLDEADAFLPLKAPKWYGVTTNPRCEKRAALSIMDALKPRDTWRDLAVYLPVETYWARHARKVESRTRPLLLRYVFVYIREDDMHVVKACDGVMDWVRGPGGFPCLVNVKELNALRDREEDGEFDGTRSDDFGGEFQPGDQIEVKLGKFTGWPCKVVKMTSAEKVRVVLSMFGKEHEKELRTTELRAA